MPPEKPPAFGPVEWVGVGGLTLLALGIAVEFSLAWSAIVLGALLLAAAVYGVLR